MVLKMEHKWYEGERGIVEQEGFSGIGDGRAGQKEGYEEG